MYIFLSHSSKDAAIAQELCTNIENNGDSCFLAPRDIRSGYEYASEIVNGIDSSNLLLLVLSENSNNSPHVLREIERAVTKSIPIIVYKLEEVALTKSMEYFLMTHQWLNYKKGDFTDVIQCINNLKNASITSGPIIPNTSEAVKPVKKSRRKYILPIVIAFSALIISGAIIASALYLKDNPANGNDNEPTFDVSIDNHETTASEETTTATVDNPIDEPTSELIEDSTTPPSGNNSTTVADVKIGDTVIFGKYNNADIVWQVFRLNDDNTAVLLSKDVITIKGFDGADGGFAGYESLDAKNNGADHLFQADLRPDVSYELQVKALGNSSWEASTIRAWLNSDQSIVKYSPAKPSAAAFADYSNGYSNEPGFLYNFTEEERNAIIETTVTTKGNVLSDNQTDITKDKVFLLSVDEFNSLDDSLIRKSAVPTPQAVEKNENTYYKYYIQDTYHTDSIPWWLRDSVENSAVRCYLVVSDIYSKDLDDTSYVCVEGYGIRPAITVDLTSGLIKAE